MAAPRVVSLLPSATEIVAALGFRNAMVGRSHECDYPPGVEELPVCTETRVDASASGQDIHRRVEALLSEALSVYRVDAERLQRLQPTHIVTQVQCEVCAASLSDVERALSTWTSAPPALVALDSTSLDGVFLDIERVADALSADERGRGLVDSLRERVASIAGTAASARARPRVATIEWLTPLMAAGNWMPEIIENAGGTNLFGATGKHSPWMEWETLRAADPDVLLVFPCGFSLSRLQREIDRLTSLPGFEDLTAVRAGRVFLAEGNQLFNRPGPRIVETLEATAEMLHPELFRFGHEGSSWRRLSLR
jgi:iron complex transport system substrate-binding protein